MAAAQHKLSRRSLLAAACAAPAMAAEGKWPLVRHAGPDPASTFLPGAEKERWIPDQVRDDEDGQVRDDGGGQVRDDGGGQVRDDGGGEGRWLSAVARYRRTEAGLEAVAHSENDDVYDRALGRHSGALACLLRAPAPNLAAVARKLDLIVRHSVFELPFGEASVAALRRDVLRLAAQPGPVAAGRRTSSQAESHR